jgi:hypothetical protein
MQRAVISRIERAARLGRSHGAKASQTAVKYLATLFAAALSMVALNFMLIVLLAVAFRLVVAIAGPLPIPP